MSATTLNKLVFELAELRRATVRDTDTLDRRMLIDWVQSQRARLVKQSTIDKGMQSIDDNLIQTLGTVDLVQVSSNDLSIDDHMPMLRTTLAIPKAIETRDGASALTRVGPPSKLTIHYPVVTYDRALVFGNSHFNVNSICAFPYGEYVYLYSKSGNHLTLTSVNIRGVFQNAVEAAIFADATWTYNDAYPLNQSMIDQLKMLIVKEKLELSIIQPHDKTDDDIENFKSDANVQKR